MMVCESDKMKTATATRFFRKIKLVRSRKERKNRTQNGICFFYFFPLLLLLCTWLTYNGFIYFILFIQMLSRRQSYDCCFLFHFFFALSEEKKKVEKNQL